MSFSVNSVNSTYEPVITVSSDCSDRISNDKMCTKYGACEKQCSVLHFKPKVYKARFLMLFLYSVCTLLNGFQWIQYSSIASVITHYYHVSVVTTNWTSVLFNIMFLPFVIPAAWLMSNKGMRLTLILASAGNSISACIQCLTISPHRFYMVILTQTIGSVAQVFSLCASAYVAALWFPSSSVSTACAAGVQSNQLGAALGLIIPSLLVHGRLADRRNVIRGLRTLALGQAVINTIVFLAIVLFYEDKPPSPPSVAEANKPSKPTPTLQSIMDMIRNKNFFVLLVASGISSAVYFSILTMLNQMVVRKFPGREILAGWMGVENIIAGIVGSLITGYILDRTNKFRETSLVLYFLSFISMIVYTAVFNMPHIWLYFFMFGVLGFIMSSYVSVACQLGAEITYPEPEGTSTTLLVASYSLLGIFVTMFASWLEQTYGDMYSNLFFCVCLGLGCFLSLYVKCDNRRSNQEYVDSVKQPA